MPHPLIEYGILFGHTAVVWCLVLIVYHFLIEAVDVGSLVTFGAKSLVLVAIVSVVIMVIPFGFGWLLSLAV